MAWWTCKPVAAALVRRIPANVVNLSARGCLIQTVAPLTPGAIGLLQLDHAATEQSEAIRVCHSVGRSGGPLPFCAGAEFLVLDAASAASIRATASRLEATPYSSRSGDAGENSGAVMTGPKAEAQGLAQATSEIACDPKES